MGRWRAPLPASSPYITPQGFAVLQQEAKELWLRRRDVVKALAAAAAEGDRSENAEYIYRKKELGGIDHRIHYLQKRLPDLNIVREQPADNAIYFGAIVDLSDEDGEQFCYRIVGPDETDSKTNAISIDSPLARALLKKRVGDEVALTTNNKVRRLQVDAIRYDGPVA